MPSSCFRYNLEDFLEKPSKGDANSMPPTALPIISPAGTPIGSITLALSGRSILSRVQRDIAVSATMTIEVVSVALTSSAARDKLKQLTKRQDRPSVYVLVDALGVQEDKTASVELDLKGNNTPIGFSKRYSLERGTTTRKAIADALRSDDETDSEVREMGGRWCGVISAAAVYDLAHSRGRCTSCCMG